MVFIFCLWTHENWSSWCTELPICNISIAVDGCSSPAPGFFNDDDTVDFMLHLNHGVYPDYDYSMVSYSLQLRIMLRDVFIISIVIIITMNQLQWCFCENAAGPLYKWQGSCASWKILFFSYNFDAMEGPGKWVWFWKVLGVRPGKSWSLLVVQIIQCAYEFGLLLTETQNSMCK